MDKAGLSNVTIVEAAAAPLMRDPDFKGITFVLSVFAALLISIGSAVVTEMLNPVMNSDIDVRHHLGLPVLAEVPLNGIESGNGHDGGGGSGGAELRTEVG
jgi:capsular polysaccharide biosynthesis protein